jgi:hypothetical protein
LKKKAMTNTANNPWAGMPLNSRRRVSAGLPQDFFWLTDDRGRYGLYLNSAASLDNGAPEISLRGITVLVDNVADRGSELYLLLNGNEDWELFLALCSDLTAACAQLDNSADWIPIIRQRLRRWHLFLKQNSTLQLSLEQQMGLFSELAFLREFLLSAIGTKDSLNSWVGPDFDKQDFSLPGRLVEIKSYPSSRGPVVQISSLQQLDNSIKPLSLVAYGLTRTDSGSSIQDLVQQISSVLAADSSDWPEIFAGKLAEYGYFDWIPTESLYRFAVDKISAFAVSDSFPRLLAKDVSSRIVSVKYTIDLSKCTEFEIPDPASVIINVK